MERNRSYIRVAAMKGLASTYSQSFHSKYKGLYSKAYSSVMISF